jgi:hypothetical protein
LIPGRNGFWRDFKSTKARNMRCGLSLDSGPAGWEGLATSRALQVRTDHGTSFLNPGWKPYSFRIHCVPAGAAERFIAARAISRHSFCALR